MHDACIFQIKNTMLFFYLDSNYCTLLLKNCTCNLFCQQLGNKEIMRMYLYLFENGCICVCMYIRTNHNVWIYLRAILLHNKLIRKMMKMKR